MGKKIDLTGQRFGKWTVLYEISERKKNGGVVWHCKCDCGNEKDAMGLELRKGRTKSCGCSRKERFIQNNPNQKDLTNQKFGLLTALYPIKKDSKRYWHCKCDCGNECDVTTSNLNSGQVKSCGCLKITNLIGQQFGFLTVLNDTGLRSNNGNIIWHCRCKCGNECDVNGDALRSGNTKSCGCLGRSVGESLVNKILKENNISFQREFRFQNCKDKIPLPFDFYVNNKYIIEFDGIQHFEITGGWNKQDHFEETQKHDQIKNQWCKDNNIPLIRIPYTHLDELCLEDLIPETSKFLIKGDN